CAGKENGKGSLSQGWTTPRGATMVGRRMNRGYRACMNFLSLSDYARCGRHYRRNVIRSIVGTMTGPYDPSASPERTPQRRTTNENRGTRSRRWRRHPPLSTHCRARKAGTSFRERLSDLRLRPFQPGEFEDLHRLRARAVQARVPGEAHP